MNEYISKEEAINAIKSLESSMPAKDNYAKGYDAALGRALIAVREVPPAADVQPVNQWISVKERLPETPEEGLGVRYSDCCLVCDSHDWCGMAYYLTDDKKSWWEFADAQNKVKIDWTEVTHWMPLPEPPKDGET